MVRSDQLSIGVDVARKLVRDCAMAPAGGRWQIIVFEDADRLTEGAANVLLKGIEEPSARTVWILCAPSSRDLLPTILSRCRQLNLRTPAVRGRGRRAGRAGRRGARAGPARGPGGPGRLRAGPEPRAGPAGRRAARGRAAAAGRRRATSAGR